MSVSQVAKGRLMDGAELHAREHRAAKGHPFGGFKRSGGVPKIGTSFSFVLLVWSQKSCRVGMAGPVEDILDLPLLHD